VPAYLNVFQRLHFIAGNPKNKSLHFKKMQAFDWKNND